MLFYRHADEFYYLHCIYIYHSFISSSDDRVRIQNENHETDKYLPDKMSIYTGIYKKYML